MQNFITSKVLFPYQSSVETSPVEQTSTDTVSIVLSFLSTSELSIHNYGGNHKDKLQSPEYRFNVLVNPLAEYFD